MRKITPQKAEQRALRAMLTEYFSRRGRELYGNPKRTENGVVVRFTNYHTMLLSEATLEIITKELLEAK